jgi:hypothetical protein
VGDQWQHLIPLLTEDLETDGSLVTLVDTVDEAVTALASALDDR